MKATSRIAGALLPLLIGAGLLTACQGNGDEGAGEDAQMTEDAAASADAAASGADDAPEGIEPEDVTEGVELDDVTDGETDAWDVNGERADGEETAGTNTDEADESGLNRFAPEAGMPREQLSNYWTSMDIEIDGESVGTMTFELWADAAPVTVRNHLRLVDEGFYDGLTFHRIIRDFMIQGGDPLGTGTGNSPYGTIEAEFSRDAERSHEYGVLSMARTQMPNTASSQFFVVCDNAKARQLNGQYASFGRLTTGVETLEAIANIRATAPNGMRPAKRAVIKEATVHEGEPPTGETIQRPQ